MTISTKRQETQANVLVALRLIVSSNASAEYIGQIANISTNAAAAALKLLEDKGLVKRSRYRYGVRWSLTDEGRNAEAK